MIGGKIIKLWEFSIFDLKVHRNNSVKKDGDRYDRWKGYQNLEILDS